MSAENQTGLMRRALEAARRGWGATHPNPMVGALIVEHGRVVADGYHARAGEPHAEVVALTNLGRAPAPGATLYVTLEPCSTTGRTPPCTEAIIRAGIKRVVAGAADPNPQHLGRGFALLRAAGVEVVEGVLAEECTDLNFIFNHWITKETPLIAGKIVTTLDGRVATSTGESQWITGAAARRDAMRWRRLFPAIGVGAGTVLADNPRLTSRNRHERVVPATLHFRPHLADGDETAAPCLCGRVSEANRGAGRPPARPPARGGIGKAGRGSFSGARAVWLRLDSRVAGILRRRGNAGGFARRWADLVERVFAGTGNELFVRLPRAEVFCR